MNAVPEGLKNAARMCPRCGADSTVYDSRERPDGQILRKRQCQECGAKFETLESFRRYVVKRGKRKFRKH